MQFKYTKTHNPPAGTMMDLIKRRVARRERVETK